MANVNRKIRRGNCNPKTMYTAAEQEALDIMKRNERAGRIKRKPSLEKVTKSIKCDKGPVKPKFYSTQGLHVLLTKGIDLCNRTACQTTKHVYYWNETMQAFYCPHCADAINEGCIGESYYPLCVIDKDKYKEVTGTDYTGDEF